MEINEDLEISLSSPVDCLVQDIQLPLDVWVTVQWGEGPVPKWNANVIEAIVADLSEVVFGDPSIPVILQSAGCSVLAEGLSIGILIHDRLA